MKNEQLKKIIDLGLTNILVKLNVEKPSHKTRDYLKKVSKKLAKQLKAQIKKTTKKKEKKTVAVKKVAVKIGNRNPVKATRKKRK